MAGFVKLAVAGAGKTTWLGKQIDSRSRNILITFTNQNVANLKEKIKNVNYDKIPQNTKVLTYTKFLYYWVIKPCEELYVLNSGEKMFGNGMTIKEPAEFDRYNLSNGYVKDSHKGHYLDKNGQYYVTRLSKLFIKQKASVKKTVKKYIGKFIDNIYIDEFQDFVSNDYKLLMELAKSNEYNTYMVGDYYQSLVTSTNSRGSNALRPYSKSTNYRTFIEKLRNEGIEVDTTTLLNSWRCPYLTCKFIRERLGINIYSEHHDTKHNVKIIRSEDEAIKILKNNGIVKLVYNSKVKGFDRIINKNKWGYSKGSTYNETCVILTKTTGFLTTEISDSPHIKGKALHTLYVALTRSSGNTYLLNNSLYLDAIEYL